MTRTQFHTPGPAVSRLAVLCLAAAFLLPGGTVAQDAGAGPQADQVQRTLRNPAASGQREPTFEEKLAELTARTKADPADGVAWNDLGVLLANEGRMEGARDAFIRAIQTSPREGDYHRNLGTAFSQLGEYDLAVAEFSAYRRFDTFGGKDYWRLIGKAQLRADLPEAARVTYLDGIAQLGEDLTPEKMRLVLALLEVDDLLGDEQAQGQILQEYAPRVVRWLEGRTDPEEDGWAEARALVANRVTRLVEDGKLLEQSGLAGEATELFREAYELAPDRTDLLPRLVDAYLSDGKELEARVATRLARDRHPDQPGTWIATAKVKEKQGSLEEAVQAYQKAYELDSSVEDLRVAIGNLLMRLGRDAEAARYLREGVNAADTKPEVVYNYAVSQMREKKYHAAIPSLRAVVKQLPDFAQGWLALAQCLQATGQYAAAVEPYEKAYALNPDPKLAFQAASCAQKGGQPQKAISGYRIALGADPTYAKARYNLSLSLMDAGRYPEAVASLDTLMALEGPSYRAYYSQGLSYYYQKDYPMALEALELALELQENANLMNTIGRVYHDMGNQKEAVVWYEMAKKFQE